MHRNEGYDVIVVGAGSSGAAIAARLSENPDRRVLLLEAGPDYRSDEAPQAMRSPNPMGIVDTERFPQFVWTDLQARRTASQAPRLYHRGRGLGGSSAINYQMAHRTMLEDYDRWAEQGCVGWTGDDLLPAMIRLENDLDFGDAPYHGNAGPVVISRQPVTAWGTVDRALLEAGLDAGHPWHADLNAPGSTGVSAMPINRTDGDRMSTKVAYLDPVRDRENLTIVARCHVDRVLFERGRAVGVRAIRDGAAGEYHGSEVIVSAGATFTPAILVRSGIGPAGRLRALGLEVVADLPVGKNLGDHAAVSVNLGLRDNARAPDWDQRFSNCAIRYSSGLAGAGENDVWVIPFNLRGYGAEALESGALVIALWETFSRGELTVTSSDPFAMPQMEVGLLSDERDLVRMRQAARDMFALAESRAVRAVAERVWLHRPSGGGSEESIADVGSDEALDQWLMETVSDTWHAVGTCRMGAPDDERSVVDPACRVLGVEGLRVVDASIMPEVPRANTNLACMTIAEHMAERMA